jgi:hypothetical protein
LAEDGRLPTLEDHAEELGSSFSLPLQPTADRNTNEHELSFVAAVGPLAATGARG